MIPRFKPYIDKKEYQALFARTNSPISDFEQNFADFFKTHYALSFMYGRAAIFSILKAYGIQNSNIIVPAYTCEVVAEAVVYSQNYPLFVDINTSDYNMNLERLQDTIDEKTRAIIATHLFGHPMDVDALENIVQNAQNRYGHKILLIQDCAHAFGTKSNGRLVANSGDAAIYGFSLSKSMTTMLGGMLTTNDNTLYEKLLHFRNEYFISNPGIFYRIRPIIYLLASRVFFHESTFGLINTAENILGNRSKNEQESYMEDISLPQAFFHQMYPLPAKIGLVQLKKLNFIIQRRQSITDFYRHRLSGFIDQYPNILPPNTPGSTYSYFVVRIPDRKNIIHLSQKHHVQLGTPLNYCLAELPFYRKYHKPGQQFTNAQKTSRENVNIPNYPSLSQSQQEQVISSFSKAITIQN